MLFSQRKGYKQVKNVIQRESIDDDLRNALWNALQLVIFDEVDRYTWISKSGHQTLFTVLWINYFKLPLDNLDDRWVTTRKWIREWYFSAEWYEVYDFVEETAKALSNTQKVKFIVFCNRFLEREVSAYRFVNDEIGEVTSKVEIEAIEDALKGSSSFPGVNEHLQLALEKFADRKNPDYRNSIKESISAVESLVCIISGTPNATLGAAIKRLRDQGLKLHPALEKAWSSLYGYTSDKEGIRHALLESSSIDPGDAKYMLVSCSAFVSYLIELAGKSQAKS